MGIYVHSDGSISVTSTPGATGSGTGAGANYSIGTPPSGTSASSSSGGSSGGSSGSSSGGGGSSSGSGTVTVYYGDSQMTVPSFDASYWQGQGWTTEQSGGNSGGSSGTTTIYNGDSQMTIPSFDLSYWQGQGWDTSQPDNQDQPEDPIDIEPDVPEEGTPTSTINALYQRYFNRNASQAEINNWKQESSQALDTFLKQEYQDAHGQEFDATTEVSAEDKAWINQLYNKYFDRPATSAELSNWAKETPSALDQFLAKEQRDYGYVSEAMGAERKARYDAAIAVIDASNLPDDIKQLWKTTVGMYPDATDFNTDEIMNTFNQIKNSTIDPYYQELADVAVNDIKTAIGQMGGSRERELEAEQAAAKQAITNTQGNLERSGMTFSGKGVEQLGTGSAYAPEGTAQIATPFAGIDSNLMQGLVGQQNRLISTSTAARYEADQQALGRQAENFLGTGAAAIPGLNYTPAGVDLTGSNALAKETKTASTLQQLIDQWRAKQENALN